MNRKDCPDEMPAMRQAGDVPHHRTDRREAPRAAPLRRTRAAVFERIGDRTDAHRRHGGGVGPPDGLGPDGRGAGPVGPSGLPGLRHHLLRVSQPGPVGLPPRLCLLPYPTGPVDRQHPRRIGTRRQAAQPIGCRQRKPHPTDPFAPRNEGSHRRRELRARLAIARRNPADRKPGDLPPCNWTT